MEQPSLPTVPRSLRVAFRRMSSSLQPSWLLTAPMLQLSVPDLPLRPRQVFQLTLPGQRVLLLTLLTLRPPAAKLLLSGQWELLLTLLTLQSPAATLLLLLPQAFQLTLPGQWVLLLTLLTLQRPAAKLLLSVPQACQLTLGGQRVLLLTLVTLKCSPATLPISPPQAFQRRPPSQPALFLTALLRRPRLQLTLPGQRVLLLRLLTLQRFPATLPISPSQAFQRSL
jgi:hypothetical protein